MIIQAISTLTPQIATGAVGSAQPSGAGAVGFSETLGRLAMGAVSDLRSAEQASALGLQGAIPAREVVDQVMAAERSFQATLAVRDKIVSSYVELSRMAI